jgi:hypothetical protein
LIYEKALDPDPAVSDGMILHLEHLQRRKKVFQQLDKFSFAGANLRPVDLLLSKLYLKHGRKDEAQKILNDQFQNAMDILEDDFSGMTDTDMMPLPHCCSSMGSWRKQSSPWP